MAPSKKKQKAEGAASGVTLHHFFTPADRDPKGKGKATKSSAATSGSGKGGEEKTQKGKQNAPSGSKSTRNAATPVVIVIDDSDDEEVGPAVCTSCEPTAGPSKPFRTIEGGKRSIGHRPPPNPDNLPAAAANHRLSLPSHPPVLSDNVLEDDDGPSGAAPLLAEDDPVRSDPSGSGSLRPQDCTPPPQVSECPLSEEPSVMHTDLLLDQGPTSDVDDVVEIGRIHRSGSKRRETPSALTPTPSRRPSNVCLRRSISATEIIDVDALDDEGNLWDNGDDEIVDLDRDDDIPEGEEDDFSDQGEEDSEPKRKGNCLGEMVLEDAQAKAECPVCGILTREWDQEVFIRPSLLSCWLIWGLNTETFPSSSLGYSSSRQQMPRLHLRPVRLHLHPQTQIQAHRYQYQTPLAHLLLLQMPHHHYHVRHPFPQTTQRLLPPHVLPKGERGVESRRTRSRESRFRLG